MVEKPIAHLVWLQGRRAADDIEDYYEVALPGDKSVDGSEPFPVYAATPVDAERHERAVPVGYADLGHIARKEAAGSSIYPEPIGTCTVPLYASPPPPAAVQEPLAVKAIAPSEIPKDVFAAAHKAAVDWYGDGWLGQGDPETDAFKAIRLRLANVILADRSRRDGVAP
jgi:hypothetical protein